MFKIIKTKTYKDIRGKLCSLSVAKEIPFKIKRIFYIFDIKRQRGGHGHKKNKIALICINGVCEITLYYKTKKKIIILNKKNMVLIINKNIWHVLRSKKKKYSHCLYLFTQLR